MGDYLTGADVRKGILWGVAKIVALILLLLFSLLMRLAAIIARLDQPWWQTWGAWIWIIVLGYWLLDQIRRLWALADRLSILVDIVGRRFL